MRHLVLFSSLLLILLFLVFHVSLSSNTLDTFFSLAVQFKYCLSCCNLKPVPYKSIPHAIIIFTPLWTLFPLPRLLLIKCCKGNTIFQVAPCQSWTPSITVLWHHGGLKRPLDGGQTSEANQTIIANFGGPWKLYYWSSTRIKRGQGNRISYFTIVSVLCRRCCSIFITSYNGSFPGVLIHVLDEKWV